jgi:hypothetical protein
MSNQAVGSVYKAIIDEVVNSSRVDFEESGVEESVLEELRQVRWAPFFHVVVLFDSYCPVLGHYLRWVEEAFAINKDECRCVSALLFSRILPCSCNSPTWMDKSSKRRNSAWM